MQLHLLACQMNWDQSGCDWADRLTSPILKGLSETVTVHGPDKFHHISLHFQLVICIILIILFIFAAGLINEWHVLQHVREMCTGVSSQQHLLPIIAAIS